MSINSVIYKNLYVKEKGLIIPVESDLWWDYLLVNRSFHYQYESLHCHFSRDKKGYWTAIKTINGKRRAKRCGIFRDLTVDNMLNIVYQLNLTQTEYDLLQQNKQMMDYRNSRTWLKGEVDYQRGRVRQLEKKVRELELKLNEDRQNQEILNLKNQVKQLRQQIKNPDLTYTEINGKMIPVYSY